jgi:hypothetical protein
VHILQWACEHCRTVGKRQKEGDERNEAMWNTFYSQTSRKDMIKVQDE